MTSDTDIEHHSGTSSQSPCLQNSPQKSLKLLAKSKHRPCLLNLLLLQINIKLDDTNYALWSQFVEMYILCKDKLGYINGDLPQPPLIDPFFRKWHTDNAII